MEDTELYRYLLGLMVKAVDEVRKEEPRQLKRSGDETLRGSMYLWLDSKENLPPSHQGRGKGLKERTLKTGPAWAVGHFKEWFLWATHSRLEPVIEKVRMFCKCLSLTFNFFRRRITNAVSEGFNSKIQTTKKMAYGFRNREHSKIAIYFHCGGLQLYPVTHKKVG